MRFLRILTLVQYSLIILTIFCHIPFTILTFVDKKFYFSTELNQTISQIESQSQRTYIKYFSPTNLTDCDELKQYNSTYYCIRRFKTSESEIIKPTQTCPTALNYTRSNFNNDQWKYCFSQNYDLGICVPNTSTENCYRSNLESFPLQDISQTNNTITLNHYIGSVNTNNVNCSYLRNFFPNLITRTQKSYSVLNIVLLTFWFVNLIPMFFQVVVTILYLVGKNQIEYLNIGIIKITTLIILIIQIGMGIALIIVSFNIVSQSRSIMDYNQCFVGEEKRKLEEFPYLEGKLMGGFKVFVIFITLFIVMIGTALVFMETFKRVYEESETSGSSKVSSKRSLKGSQGYYLELQDYSNK